MRCKLFIKWNNKPVLDARGTAVMVYTILQTLKGEFINSQGLVLPSLDTIVNAPSDEMLVGTYEDLTGRVDYVLTFEGI